MIGHSYFLANSLVELKDKFEFEIKPLIKEYQKDGIIGISEDVLNDKLTKWAAIIE